MSLPFFKNRKETGIAGTIIENRDSGSHEDQDSEYSLEDCAKDIMAAIKVDDPGVLAFALKELVDKVNKMPREDRPSPHTYENQKED